MAIGSAYSGGTINVTGTNSSNATNIITFTIPNAGTWEIRYFATMTAGGAGLAPGYIGIFNSSNSLVPNSTFLGTQGFNISSTPVQGVTTITTTGSAVFSLRGWGINGATYQVPSGQAGVIYFSDAGFQGPKGDTGAQGIQGPIGPQGPRGLTGSAGTNGSAGAQGVAGPQGPKGDKGDPGTAGATGPAGPRGGVNLTIQTRAPNNNEGVIGDIWYQI